MKQKLEKIRLLTIIAMCILSILLGSVTDYKAEEEIYPFRWLDVEKYLEDVWVGDTLTMMNSEYVWQTGENLYNYSFEIIEGGNSAQLINDSETTTKINFIKEGVVKLKVGRSSDNAERIFEFKVGPAKELVYESKLPLSIKIGHDMTGEWYKYSNLFLEQSIPPVTTTALTYDEYCLLPGDNYGYGGWEHVTRESKASSLGVVGDEEWHWLFGSPTRPGTMYYTTGLEPDKQYSVIIEEPIIKTTFPQEIIVGKAVEVKTNLENTELTDKKVEEVKQLIAEDKTLFNFGDLIGYKPRIEVVSGDDLIQRENGDYTNILSSSEKITFLKEGTVVFKVVYEMIPIPAGKNHIFKPEAVYSPEKIFTVKIVKEKVESVQPEQPQDKPESTPESDSEHVPEQTIPNDKEQNSESNKEKVPEQDAFKEPEKQPISSEIESEDDVEDSIDTEILESETSQGIELDYTQGNMTTNALLEAIVGLNEKEKISIDVSSNVTITENVLSELKKGQHKIVVNTVNESGNLIYSWDVQNVSNDVNEWKTGIHIGTNVEQITDLLNDVQHSGTTATISFEHSGVLPGKTNVKLFVGDKFLSEEIVFYYYHNLEKNIFEKIGEYTVDENGYVEVQMEHCSDYVLTNKAIEYSVGVEPEETEVEDKNNADESSSSVPMKAIVGVVMLLIIVGIGMVYVWKKRILK